MDSRPRECSGRLLPTTPVLAVMVLIAGAPGCFTSASDNSRDNQDEWVLAGTCSLDPETTARVQEALASEGIPCRMWGSPKYGIYVPRAKAQAAYTVLSSRPALPEGYMGLVVPAFPIDFRTRCDMVGWCGDCVDDFEVVGRALRFSMTGRRASLERAFLRIPAQSCSTLVIRMKTDCCSAGYISWANTLPPAFDLGRRLSFEAVPDGRYHSYRIPVGEHPAWSGTIHALRIELYAGKQGGAAAIEWIGAASEAGPLVWLLALSVLVLAVAATLIWLRSRAQRLSVRPRAP